MNKNNILQRCLILILLVLSNILGNTETFGSFYNINTQEDTIYAENILTPPVFDGIGNDECWTEANWQVIDQVWIPWGTYVDPADLSGRYKVVWSSDSNLLYFLLEITDDIISDAYVPNVTAAIYNFDMFEVFIDEDKSGGYHVFDGYANNEQSLGMNAENAFAYHIFTAFPESGGTNQEFIVEDMAGTNWGDVITCDYTDHFPAFILRKEGNVSRWEFSLIVYNDTYSPENIEGSRVTLLPDKLLGLSLAINDDDEPEVDPGSTVRDNFIGSVAVTAAAYNDHWKNADDFGALKLVSDLPINSLDIPGQNYQVQLNLFPNPSSNSVSVEFYCKYLGELTMTMLDMQGREILKFERNKAEDLFCENIDFHLPGGFYIIQIRYGGNIASGKIDLLR